MAVVAGLLTGGAGAAQAEPVRVAEFVADCQLSHRLPDDPIVLPNLAGASHLHDFFGNSSTNANSNLQSLAGATGNCDPLIDISSYWVPTLFKDNVPVPPRFMTFYYLGEGVNRPQDIRSYPLGLKVVAGNAKATGPNDSIARWSCLHAGHVNPSKNFVECPPNTMLETYLDFPQCWNGRDLDSPNHASHLAYPVAGGCPSSHPVSVPKLRMVLRYPVTGPTGGLRLSSGPGYTMHGDFFNVWPAAELDRRVRNCLNAVLKCNAAGVPG
ncbi:MULTISPECIES: DUF1996 domain-containing protein [unclassified Crossiella]|uniref:DUF1996 domain-containing protein n=1 Tax=unclassified Crossiella TaxID=2620835 RepID=UPI001FFF57B1|nr:MULTISPECIES: DUF1996 domain-containing protein [unclassified Crossiella]MCK2244685.1 DUF1996 domain-containing protein [Crossiella sp. S99.2]MCK2258328.1 DUF1996 domain-containing protein [Crossiella sp. S99.1]